MIGSRFPGYETLPRAAQAGVIVVHGIAEHGARYRHAAAALAANDIASFVYDQRGHGMSPGARAHVENFADFAGDLQLIGEDLRERFPKLPLFVWGHSMGSIVLVLAATQGLSWARGAITTGCALDAMPKLDGIAGGFLRMASSLAPRLRISLRIDAMPKLDGIAGTLLKGASALAPRLRISLRIDAAALTHVLEEQRKHMSDPLIPRTASLRLLYGFALACGTCRTDAAKITLPWLAVHGEADKVCPISGSQELIGSLSSRDKQLVTYAGLLHEVHNEDERARAALFDLMSRWILERA